MMLTKIYGSIEAVLPEEMNFLISNLSKSYPEWAAFTGTRITSSLQCIRKAALEERYPGSSNAKALEGTLLHDLLQVRIVQSLHATPYIKSRKG